MAIEAGTSTYYQAKRDIPQDNLLFYIDPSVKSSYRNIGDDQIYSLINPTHYMNTYRIGSNTTFIRNRQDVGLKETTNNVGPLYIEGLASSYGLSMIDCTYVFYAKCVTNFPVSGGAFSNWILQIGTYYGDNSWGIGLQSNSFMVYARGASAGGWTYASGSTNGQSIYSNNLNKWIFYVVQFVGNNAFKVYMNNTLCYNASSLAHNYTAISNNAIYLGRSQQETVGLFAVYGTVLSDDKISDFYNATRHRFGL